MLLNRSVVVGVRGDADGWLEPVFTKVSSREKRERCLPFTVACKVNALEEPGDLNSLHQSLIS
jgi:hypothetical protein